MSGASWRATPAVVSLSLVITDITPVPTHLKALMTATALVAAMHAAAPQTSHLVEPFLPWMICSRDDWIHLRQVLMGFGARASVGSVAANASASRRSIRSRSWSANR